MTVPSLVVAVAVAAAAAAYLSAVGGKLFSRCELVRELGQPRHRIPRDRLATWVCIATHESQLNTSAVGHLNADGSGDHGIFQISDQYWCSPPGRGQACGLNCNQLEDDDITDDVVCARRVYRATERRTGDGFTAWAVYPRCRDAAAFAEGCDEEEDKDKPSASEYSALKPSSIKPETSSSTTTEEPTSSAIDWDSSSTSTDTSTSTYTSTSTSTETSTSSTSTDVYPSLFTMDDAKSSQRSLHQLQLALTKPDGPFVGYNLVSDEDRRAIADFLGRSGRTAFGKSGGQEGQSAVGETSSASSGSGPLAAWLDVHYDPRFLDRP